MEMVGKVSRGSRMDQIYIPKNRHGFGVGDHVVIRPLEKEEIAEKPYFYNIRSIEPAKMKIIGEIFNIIEKRARYDNIIITGSFLDKGFNFNDIDILMVSGEKIDTIHLKELIEKQTGIKTHIILLDNKTVMEGLSTDPLYQVMLSRCISKKRMIYKVSSKINYKILDLQLLKSKTLINNFDILDGNEKYYLTRNMIAISLFLKFDMADQEKIDQGIRKIFGIKDIKQIKGNMLKKEEFIKIYKQVYKETFNLIMEGIKYGPKQEKTNQPVHREHGNSYTARDTKQSNRR